MKKRPEKTEHTLQIYKIYCRIKLFSLNAKAARKPNTFDFLFIAVADPLVDESN